MLSLRIILKSYSQYIKQTRQQFHMSVKLLTANSHKDSSSSSSSDSSDSDSDSDKKNEKVKEEIKEETKETASTSGTNERLNNLLYNLVSNETKKKKETINVSIKPRKKRFQGPITPPKPKPFDQQLVEAAKDIATALGGDTQKTELELLSKVLQGDEDKTEKPAETVPTETTSLGDLLSSMKIQIVKTSDAPDMQRQKKSITESLLRWKPKKSETVIDITSSKSTFGIFTNKSNEETKDSLNLPTWNAMEMREIKLSTISPPQNVFQELIQWTEQGKLWHFPINNEQGMEEEEKVHFSKHVFMESHLKGWCPKKGPIRHFMELVCVGLSKNPYLTVNEKVAHITWYKKYFENKKDLLNDLGLLDKQQDTKEMQQIQT